MLMSPMDTHATTPRDARPDAETIAGGFERLAKLAPTLVPRTVRKSWAGLRTFSPDGIPVVGADTRVEGMFWLAGQGGCGIETSPAIGAIAADLLVDGTTERFDATALSPARFAIPSAT
jgi:D-arginine dehydrogenase